MKAKLEFDKIINADTILFFDMDGTLIDTDYVNYLSYKKAIHKVTQNGFNLSFNLKERFNRSQLKNVIPNLSHNDYEKIIQEKEKYYVDFLPELKLNKDVYDILIKYSPTHKTVLVTNCRKDRVFVTLNHFGLTDKFNNIFYRQLNGDMIRINKYEYAINQLNISLQSVVVIENEEKEIIDAIKIGIPIEKILKF